MFKNKSIRSSIRYLISNNVPVTTILIRINKFLQITTHNKIDEVNGILIASGYRYNTSFYLYDEIDSEQSDECIDFTMMASEKPLKKKQKNRNFYAKPVFDKFHNFILLVDKKILDDQKNLKMSYKVLYEFYHGRLSYSSKKSVTSPNSPNSKVNTPNISDPIYIKYIYCHKAIEITIATSNFAI
ncbi:hypothetical protein AGLY_004422 [Aphis glycines]|uniref:Uncharacterized protein n=1 Tax=Aphis glycines TaxID=307491 RepID=A0A6G0U0H6_APHGL|nr:hypothetical protein AGLY_004422 [Aphis glycines]